MAWTGPRTWVVGEAVTAALMNAHIRDNLKALGDALSSYTPTLTNGTVGNGTITGNYTAAGKRVWYRGRFTLGSTSTISATPLRISLPVAHVSNQISAIAGVVYLLDSSASARRAWLPLLNDSNSFFVTNPADGTNVGTTNPWTWATGDVIDWDVSYESA